MKFQCDGPEKFLETAMAYYAKKEHVCTTVLLDNEDVKLLTYTSGRSLVRQPDLVVLNHPEGGVILNEVVENWDSITLTETGSLPVESKGYARRVGEETFPIRYELLKIEDVDAAVELYCFGLNSSDHRLSLPPPVGLYQVIFEDKNGKLLSEGGYDYLGDKGLTLIGKTDLEKIVKRRQIVAEAKAWFGDLAEAEKMTLLEKLGIETGNTSAPLSFIELISYEYLKFKERAHVNN